VLVLISDFYLPAVLVVVLILGWRSLTVIRDNTAAGLATSEKTRRDDRIEMAHLLEKVLIPNSEHVAEGHRLERMHRIDTDAAVEKARIVTPHAVPRPEAMDNSIVNTDNDFGLGA